MRLISLAAQTVLDVGPVGLVRAAAQSGFRWIGPRIEPVLTSDPPVCGLPIEREFRDALKETGVQVLEAGVFPIAPDIDFERFERCLALGGEIAARFVGCPCDDPDRVRRQESLARLCELAAPYAMTVLIEFSPRRACANLTDAYELVTSTRCHNIGLLVDALHLSRSGGHPRDLAQIDPRYLQLVHLCDAMASSAAADDKEGLRREANAERLYPGEGELWLESFVAALPPGTPISIEAPSRRHRHLPAAERARRALAATQDLLRRCTAI